MFFGLVGHPVVQKRNYIVEHLLFQTIYTYFHLQCNFSHTRASSGVSDSLKLLHIGCFINSCCHMMQCNLLGWYLCLRGMYCIHLLSRRAFPPKCCSPVIRLHGVMTWMIRTWNVHCPKTSDVMFHKHLVPQGSPLFRIRSRNQFKTKYSAFLYPENLMA